jgi:hypothetical protein
LLRLLDISPLFNQIDEKNVPVVNLSTCQLVNGLDWPCGMGHGPVGRGRLIHFIPLSERGGRTKGLSQQPQQPPTKLFVLSLFLFFFY